MDGKASSRSKISAASAPAPRAGASPTSSATSSGPTSATAPRASSCAASASSAATRSSRPGMTATTPASTASANSSPSTKMPPREFQTPRAKREELTTYRELELRRDLKSLRQRRRLEANGVRRVLGDGSSGQPYLVVTTRRYREVRLEIERRLLLQAQKTGLDLPADLLLRQLKPRIEALTYAQLAGEAGDEAPAPCFACPPRTRADRRGAGRFRRLARRVGRDPRRTMSPVRPRTARSTRCLAKSSSARPIIRPATRRSGRRSSGPMRPSNPTLTGSIPPRQRPGSAAPIQSFPRISNAGPAWPRNWPARSGCR